MKFHPTWLCLFLLTSPAFADPVVDLVASKGKFDEVAAAEHVQAALAAATPKISASLLLGIAWEESGYNPTLVSRIECNKANVCARKTGSLPSRKKPKNVRGPYFCGLTQLKALTWKQCLALRDDLEGAYLGAATHLAQWMDEGVCRWRKGDKRIACGLLGYGGGWQAIERAKSTYPARIMARARRFARLVPRSDV